MYQVGANNPNEGNDRRKQLLQTLFQQFQQRQAAQQQVGNQAASSFFNRKRSQSLLPSSPTRNAMAGRNTASSVLTQGNNIPGALHGALGPGGGPRSDSGAGGLANLPSHITGNPFGGLGSPIPGVIQPGGGPGGGGAGAPIPPGMDPGSLYNPTDPSGNSQYVQTSPATDTNAASYGPNPNADPGNLAGAQQNLVPLGNGMYYDPVTGAVRGGGALGLGSAASNLNPIDKKF